MSEAQPATYIKACVLMCKRPAFWLFLSKASARLVTSEDDALRVVRLLVGIRSRRELVKGSRAGESWKTLITDFNKEARL